MLKICPKTWSVRVGTETKLTDLAFGASVSQQPDSIRIVIFIRGRCRAELGRFL